VILFTLRSLNASNVNRYTYHWKELFLGNYFEQSYGISAWGNIGHNTTQGRRMWEDTRSLNTRSPVFKGHPPHPTQAKMYVWMMYSHFQEAHVFKTCYPKKPTKEDLLICLADCLTGYVIALSHIVARCNPWYVPCAIWCQGSSVGILCFHCWHR
jgi:hypothetical protein